MNIKRVVAAAALSVALTGGVASVAVAAPVKPSGVTVKAQAAKNVAAVKAADRKCGKWTPTITRKAADCRWVALRSAGYVAPKKPLVAKKPLVVAPPDSGEGGPDFGTLEWDLANRARLGFGAASDASSVDLDGDGVVTDAEIRRAARGLR